LKIVNPTLTRSFLRRGKCRFCGKGPIDLCGHHLFSKGAGQLDISINLIALGMPLTCDCHGSHHDGNEPSFEQLLALSAQDHDCLQGDIETVVYLLRDQLPKGATVQMIERAGKKLGLGARRLLLKELRGFRHLLE
jgi:hypothetical protein